MIPDEEQELRELHARAYGPGADISGDESALRRLHELETRRRVAASRRDAPEPVAVVEPELPADDGSGTGRDVVTPRETAGRRLPRRLVWAWSGSLAVMAAATAVVASVVTATIAPPAPMVAGVRHEATLSPDESFSWPGMFDDGTGRFFASYAGFVPIATTVFGERECLLLYQVERIDPSSPSYEGDSQWGCGGGGFPPSVVAPLDDETETGDGTAHALQFVLRGSVVEVYSDAGAVAP